VIQNQLRVSSVPSQTKCSLTGRCEFEQRLVGYHKVGISKLRFDGKWN